MPSIHLFNPENDIALAAGTANFTPPKGALAISRAGEPLPLWWAEEDDAILVTDDRAAAAAERLKREYRLEGEIRSNALPEMKPEPWGWSLYTRRRFISAGADEKLCPTDETLERIRQLSHRRTTIAIHRAIGTPDSLMPVEAATTEDAMKSIELFGDAVVKLPWSSSGRGVMYTRGMTRTRLIQQIAGMTGHQGSVLIEPCYDRVRDFAALFHSDGKEATFQGLSMFSTDPKGFYTGNIVAPQEVIAERTGIDTEPYISLLLNAVSSIVAPHYSGWFGVDMLVYRDKGGKERVAPCIEINLRRTMGVAALLIERRLKPDTPHILTLSAQEGIGLVRGNL